MKKRFISVFLTLLLLVSLCPGAAAAYTDVPSTCWSYADITEATRVGLFQGTTATTFDRSSNITRAQFITALVRLFGWESVSPASPTYSDCTAERWFYSAVETAHANGALPVYASTVRPTEPITREEMASMLVRALGYSALAGRMSTAELPFSDVTSNRGYIVVAYDLGIITGYPDSTFQPRGSATREQAAVMLMRVYRKLHAQSVNVTASASSYLPVRVSSPAATAETAIPTTPLEPIEELYKILHQYKVAGTDMNRLALVLTAGGIATTTQGSRIVSTETISAAEVAELLALRNVNTYYSQQYQSAYLTRSGGSNLTVWYQSAESLAAKLQLARLFGINHYVLQDTQ